MLTVFEGERPRSRRELLRIGGLGLGGLSLSNLFAENTRADNGLKPLTGKSVVFVFQQGGPSQHETFDPKPHAPSGTRTVGDAISTSLPGVHFGETMERLAELAHRLVVVRSFATGNAGHNIHPIVSDSTRDANLGVHFARVAGTTRPSSGMPTNSVLFPATVDDTVPGPSARGDIAATGDYGRGYAPFVPGSGGQLQADMTLSLSRERFLHDRQALLKSLDRLHLQFKSNDQLSAIDEIRAQAYDVLLGGGVAEAMDLSREDPETLAMYDTDRFTGGSRWHQVNRGRRGYYDGQTRTIGRLMLLARRLCEAGCGFITIHAGYEGVWDMHADGNNLNMQDGMQAVGRSFDHAMAAFIRDCEQRGLSDQTLLVCCGEMGRTPRLNSRGGRDHWSRLAPLLLHGGGIGNGLVIGESDRLGGEPSSQPFDSAHLISSVLRTVMDPAAVRLIPGIPRALTELLDHPPISGLGLA